MNSINASSLFHFTREFETLKAIIRNGLRYSFAFEQYSKDIVMAYINPINYRSKNFKIKNDGAAIPMISFCDIPLTRASQHINKYGNYMIGLNKKEFTRDFKNLINPVMYVHSPNLKDAIKIFGVEYAKAYCDFFELIKSSEFINKYKGCSSDDLLSSKELRKDVKEIIDRRFASNFLIGLIKPIKNKGNYFYDEREWRTFFPERLNEIEWIWGISKDDYKKNVDSWNSLLNTFEDCFIKIPEECIDKYINHIVVADEHEIDELIDYIMSSEIIFGYENISNYSRMKLVSKLSSMDRINNDY